jgi:hypothetical membrane protein
MRAGRRLVAALLVVGAVGSWVVEALVAAAWADPGYSYVEDKISALGVPGEPGWTVMDVTWAAQGGLIAVVAVLLGRGVTGRRGRLVTAIGLVQGIGFVMFAAFHDSAAARAGGTVWLYFTGATLGIVAGSALTIAVGPALQRLGVPRWTGILGVVLGAVGLVSAVATLGWAPLGLAERISVYTFLLLQLALGLALTRGRSPGPVGASDATRSIRS